MKQQTSIWKKLGLHDWFLKKENTQAKQQVATVTPEDVFRYIVEKFKSSIGELSFANRIVFYHEFIICFNPDDYNEFVENKKGLFGIIIHESVKQFYEVLKAYRQQGKTVEASANKWVFRFVSNPAYARGDKSFIGKLLPTGTQQKEENLRVTFIPRQTGIAETYDINDDILKDFTFYSEGYYEVPFREDLMFEDGKATGNARPSIKDPSILARLETIIPDKEFAGKKIEYLMRDNEIMVTGKDEQREASNVFRIPSEWVNTPHLRIRYNKGDSKFSVASFGEKTLLNEHEVPQSDANNMTWIDLPVNSRMMLNGIVGINIFKG